MKNEMHESMTQDDGDYFERCFPKTFAEFSRNFHGRVEESDHDPFDTFLVNTFPFFGRLVREYYSSNQDNRIQFQSIASPDRLASMDDLLLRQLLEPHDSLDRAVKNFYIHILEECVIREVRKNRSL